MVVLVASCSDLPLGGDDTAPLAVAPLPKKGGARPAKARPTLLSPVRIARNGAGNLFVSDFGAHAVFKLDRVAAGFKISGTLSLPEPPLGVAWAPGRLFVGNAVSGNVDVYDFDRKRPRWLYSLGAEISDPTDIAVDIGRGLVFVLDGRAGRIRVFTLADGSHLYDISGPGESSSALQNPTGLAVDEARQEVLVSDYGTLDRSGEGPAVKVFGYDGALAASIAGKFSRPQGLAVSDAGSTPVILLADALAGVVLIINRSTGGTLGTIGTQFRGNTDAPAPGELWLPLDLVLVEGGEVLVTNNRARRIESLDAGSGLP